MTIVHLVLFSFKDGVDEATKHDIMQGLLELKEQCLHPATNKPYLKSLRAGKDNSPEGWQGGITHALVAEFEDEDDREFYIKEDPAHLACSRKMMPHLEEVRVVDFTPSVF